MSRIGRLPITVPAGVEVKLDGSVISVKGSKGELSHTVASPIEVSLEENTLTVTRPNDERASRSLHVLFFVLHRLPIRPQQLPLMRDAFQEEKEEPER
jgi:ribosomal protein L6P/L9E